MTLDISGLKPLDTNGLQPMGAAPTLDTSKLKPLDVSGLQPVDQGGFLDNAKSLVTTGLTALNRGMLSTGQMVNATRARALMDAESQARVRQADEANPTLRDVPVQQNLPTTLDTGSYAEADRRRLAEAKPYDTTVPGRDPEEYAARVKANLADLARREVEIKKLPAPKVVQDALQSKTFGEFWTNFKKAPATIITSIGLESAPISLGIAGATAVGGATAGVPGAMATTGAVSYAVEYTASITDAMREEGVDFSDPASVEKALADDKLMARIEKRAAERAGPIAALDTATAGIASKVLIPARMAERLANSPVRRELTNLIPQMGAQSAGGAVGEAGAQLASGQEWNPGAIAAEAVGELVTAPADVAAASLARGERPVGDFERVLREIDGKPAPTAAGGLPTPEGLVPAQDIPPPPPAPVSSPEPQSGYETLYGDESATQPNSVATQPDSAATQPAPSAVSTVIEELAKREGGKKSPLGKGLSEITAGQKGGQAAVDRVAGTETVTFTTAKGSTYAVQADGTTVRNKKLRNDPGHEGDQGVKPKTDKTVYIPSAEAARLSAPDSATWRVIDHGDGTLSLATQNADGRWGVSPDAKNVPVTTEPAVGLTPIELWGKDKVYKYDAFKTVHFGNEIVEVNRPQPRSIPVGDPVKITTPDDSAEIEARPVLVELDTLKPASGKLQPRDRGRVEMVQEAKERAVRLDPARLMPDRVSDAGAPIVTADGTVISGNGRMLSIAEVYSNPALRAQANAYKAALPAEAQGMKKPVLVMQSQLSGLDAERFAQQSNRPRIATLSATEQAETDAAVMGDMLGLYQGGDFESAGNAQFLKAFATNVVASSERNSFSKDGQLSAEGMRRMQGAILARAYGDSSLLSRMLESTDDNVRAIVGALQDAAPQMAALRAAVQSGQVMEGLDPLADINAAVTLISDMRKRRLSPAKFFRQMDAFTEVNPDVAGWVLSLYNPADPKTNTDAGEHALSRSQMAAVFRAFANEAMQHKTGGFFDDETTRSAILGAVGRNAAQGAALAEAPGVDASDGSGGAAGGQAQAGGRGPQAALADAQTPASTGTQQGEVEPRARDEAKKRLKSGGDYEVPTSTIDTIYDAVYQDLGLVPADTMFGVVERIESSSDSKAKVGEEIVKVYFRMSNGDLGTRKYPRNLILRAAAFYDPVINGLFFVRLGKIPRLGKEGAAFAKSLRGELRHELLHVLRRQDVLAGTEWNDLVRHARRLQVLRYAQASFTQLTGKPLAKNANQQTLETGYTELYRSSEYSDKEIQENIDQEYVAHAIELGYHGVLNAKELAPLQGLIDKMELRMYGRGAKPTGVRPMASLASRDDLTPLGFYSTALRAAVALKLKRDTPNQMLKRMAGAGLKETEIQALGLRKLMEGRKSIDRDEIISHIAAHAVEVREVVYGLSNDAREYAASQLYGKPFADLTAEQQADVAQELGRSHHRDEKSAKWSEYALDGSNPSYRESVLHLPGNGPAMGQTLTIAERKAAEEGWNKDFHSGHWSEPNVISHIRSSLQKDAAGRSVYLIDELQSDWGQKVRDGGVRDEEKIATLKEASRKANEDNARIEAEATAFVDANRQHLAAAENKRNEYDTYQQVPYGVAGDLEALQKYGPAAIQGKGKELWDAWQKSDVDDSRLEAELATAEAATPAHPLVSTTDQWVGTSLRRILMQAVETGAEAVSFTPGNVQAARYSLGGKVDEIMWAETDVGGELHGQRKGDNVFYKDGLTAENLPEYVGKSVAEKLLAATPDADGFRRVSGVDLEVGGEGMRATYDNIYPKTLAKILAKFDKTATPNTRKLKSHTGEILKDNAGKDIEFITFPLTDEAKDRIATGGMPMFSLSPTSSPSLDPDDAGALRKARDSALEFLQDAQVRVRRLVERANEPLPDDADPYMAATLYHGRLGGRAEEAAGKAEAILRGANAIAKATNSPLENVKRLIDLYLVAKHAPERNAVHGDGSAGITNAEATAALSRIASLPQGAEIVAVADLVLDMNRRTLQTLLDGKVISQETFDLLSTTYANHVPLNRILPEGDEEIGAILAGGGFDVRSTGLQRARGSKLPIAPILENVLLNHQQAILRAEKNTVDLATLAFVRRFEDDLKGQITILGGPKPARTIDPAERVVRDQIAALKKMLPKDDRPHHMERMPSKTINDPRVLTLREDGETVHIRFRDPKLAAAFKSTNSEKMPKLLYPAMLYTRVMSQLATRFNPEFAIPNKMRDIQETAIYLAAQKGIHGKGAARFMLRELKGENYKAIMDWLMGRDTPGARLYQEMIMEGGTTGGFALSSRDRVQDSIKEVEKLLSAGPGNIRKNLKRVGQIFDNFNKVFEDSTRLSVYRMAKARGMSNKRAAVHAKEASINFNRMGTAGPVVNGLWMFSNAAIQGSTKIVRSMKNPKVAATVVLGMSAAVAAVGQWNDEWDEKWREKVTKWDRLNSIVVVLPGARDVPEWERGIDYMVVPVSWGLKPILNLTNYAYDATQGIDWEWSDFLHDMTISTLEAFNPLGGTNLMSAIMPSILDTPSEIWSNTSWSGSKIKPDPQNGTPEDARYFSSLSDKASGRTSIAVSETLVNSTGVSVSPADINYAFEQFVGGVGRAAGRTASTGAAILEGKPIVWDEFPFIARFYRRREAEEITGKNELGTETREARRIVEQQGRERVKRRYHLEDVVEELKTLPQDEIKKRIAAEVKKDPAALDVIKGLIEADVKGLTGLDRQINMLGVENGERASYYVKRLQEASPEERRSIVEDGVKKGLISRGVVEQMKVLGQLERLSPEQRKKFRDLASERGLRLPPE